MNGKIINIGNVDRAIRLLVGIVLIVVGYAVTAPWTIVAYIAAAIAIGTAGAGHCPLYWLLRIDTCRR